MFTASCSLGTAHKSLELSVEYVKNRKQFGKRLADFQVSHQFVKIYVMEYVAVIYNQAKRFIID